MGSIEIQPTFFDTDYACKRLGISRTFLFECRKAGLIEYVQIGEIGVRFTEAQLSKFETFVKAGGLKGVQKRFLELGIRKPRRRRMKKNGKK
jgi:hypothetical protein